MRCDPIEVTYRVRTSAWVPVSILFLALASTCQGLTNLQLIRRVNDLIDLHGKQMKVEFRLEGSDEFREEFQRSVLNRKEAGT